MRGSECAGLSRGTGPLLRAALAIGKGDAGTDRNAAELELDPFDRRFL